MSFRRLSAVVGCLAAVLLFAACGDKKTSSDSSGATKVGLVTDLSGRFVSFGKDIRAATELAVKDVAADGGPEIDLKVVDSGGDPAQAVVAYRQLRDEGAVAVLGPLSSQEAEVVFEQAKSIRVPLITGTANKEGITEAGDGWALRNTATNTALYEEAMPAWQKAFDVRSAVLVFDEEEPVSAAAAAVGVPAAAKAADIKFAGKPLTFTRGQTDFSTLVSRIRRADADGVIVMSAPTEAGLIAKELARQGESRPVLGHPSQASNSFFEAGGKTIDKWVLPSIFPAEADSEKTRAYVDRMKELDKEPPTVPEAANYYDNVLMLADVLGEAKDDSADVQQRRDAVREGLLAIEDFDGVAGTISFAGDPDAEKTVYVNVVKKGEVGPLEAE